MKADLHIHSRYSSGTQTPEAVLQEAVAKGIGLISITDDDTMDAYEGLVELARKYDIALIKGVQVSATFKGNLFRLLAYDCDRNNPRLQELLQQNRSVWEEMGRQFIDLLAADHPELSVAEYDNYRKNPVHGGFKYNSYMIHKGIDASDENMAKIFAQHRDEIKTIMQNLAFHRVEEAINIIHAAGGYAIIPGGYLRNPDTLMPDVDQLVAFGVDGLEGFSPSHSEEMAKTLRTYAKAHQLLLTGGGDGHGTWASQEKYGIGIQEVDDHALNLGAIRIFGHPINGVTLAKQTDSERKD